ncbi:IPT/TIG domain-containing protein [Methylococcus mesophilus]|uniref:IPT/TIG domain-containing protein n=1 Tax=Methylococcus mesophilus TaxID=2993564 RepID=UPI00224B28C9|nr:IPT/TIG domain-containing protein [Methylococcus mesophilus]UZR28303.1 IPT/TIG domain-containing protein [Methylococcus mesophilus]
MNTFRCPNPSKMLQVCAAILAASTAMPAIASSIAPKEGIVYITPNVDEHVKNLLRERFKLISARKISPDSQFPEDTRGVVLGGKDLANRKIAHLAKNAYNAGLTVALTNATAKKAELLRTTVGREGPLALGTGLEHSSSVPILAIREDGASACWQRRIQRTNVLQPRKGSDHNTLTGHKRADRLESEWLAGAFEKITAQANTSDLAYLMNSYLTTQLVTDSSGMALQVQNATQSIRSFIQGLDYYFVNQWVTVQKPEGQGDMDSTVTNYFGANEYPNAFVVKYDPGTTQIDTTYSASTSISGGGTVGWNRGLIATATTSYSWSSSTQTTVPPTIITYSGKPEDASTTWRYESNLSSEQEVGKITLNYPETWIWAVPFSDYGEEQQEFSYLTRATGSSAGKTVELELTSTVPLPFPDTVLALPIVESASKESAKSGDAITITGKNFYQIESVVIGGNPLPSANYEVIESDTTLNLVIPSNQPTGANQSIVLKTSQGFSNTDVTITVVEGQ